MTNTLPEAEVTQVTKLLSMLEPGFLPFELFHQIARLVVTPIIELVPLRVSATGSVEILLLPRPADDPIWPGQLHVPGTVIRATDSPHSFHDGLQRTVNELGDGDIGVPVFVKNLLHPSGRGMEATQVYWVEIKSQPRIGKFYSADKLPTLIVKTQLDFIPDAIAHFKANRIA